MAQVSAKPAQAQTKHFLREWRKWQGLSLEALEEKLLSLNDKNIPTSYSTLSRIERGELPYSQYLIEALADIYGIEPGELLFRNPKETQPTPSAWWRADPSTRAQMDRVNEALVQFTVEGQD